MLALHNPQEARGGQSASARTGEVEQIIHGHRGENIVITLRTTKDLTSVLSRVDPVQLFTSTGRRLGVDATSEEWVVTSVSQYSPSEEN